MSLALSVNTVLVEVLLVTTMVLGGSIYIGAKRWLRQQQAWQWWHEQQVSGLHDQAEVIRDGLLQQTFAFRRYLEGNVADDLSDRNSEDAQVWLDRFQLFHQSLERLSNHLSPPFLADSLPLALQFMLKEWQQNQADGINVTLKGGAAWTQEQPPEVNRAVLSVLGRLLTLVQAAKGDGRRLQIEMQQQEQCCLTLRLEGGEADAAEQLLAAPEARHLQEIFHGLVAGRLELTASDNSLIAQLSWANQTVE